jgi:lysophospholipase L1-like esterase
MIFEGVNDIGVAASTPMAQQAIGDALIAGYKQLIARSHAAGIPIFGATITPFCTPGFNSRLQAYCSEVREATRQRVNAYIRSGEFDGVVDFDAITNDPAAPSQLRTEFNSGDYLHLSVAGYQAMAAGFPTSLLA